MIELMNENVRQIETSGIRKIVNRTMHLSDVINLTFGQPDFPTPSYIKDAGKLAIDANQTGYTQNAGLPALRQTASDYVRDLYNLHYRAEDEVLITTGASEALDIAFRSILTEGCEVILPAPVYPGYEPLIRLSGATPVFIDTTDSNFKLTAAAIEEKITEKTRCIVLPYPSNPIGCVLSADEVKEIGELLQDKKIFVVADEIYSELNHDKEHVSIAAMPGMKEKTIVINGLSKSHSMTGWRIGFTYAPAYITEQMLKVHSFINVCASTMSQHAAIEALNQGVHREELIAMKNAYKQRKEFVYSRLRAMDLEVVEPEGAFYIFPSIKKTGLSSMEFAERLLEQEKLAVIPGNAFSQYGEGYIRISYAQSINELEEGMNRLENFLRKHGDGSHVCKHENRPYVSGRC